MPVHMTLLCFDAVLVPLEQILRMEALCNRKTNLATEKHSYIYSSIHKRKINVETILHHIIYGNFMVISSS